MGRSRSSKRRNHRNVVRISYFVSRVIRFTRNERCGLGPADRLVFARCHDQRQAALFAYGVGMGTARLSPVVIAGLQQPAGADATTLQYIDLLDLGVHMRRVS